MIEFNELIKYVQKGLFTMEKHDDGDLYIFGYHTGPYSKSINRWNNVTRNMRGLIIDSKSNIHSRSFEKFFTFREYLSDEKVLLSEGQVATLPKVPFKIYEKLDGSLTILYWINDTPYLSTQRSFKSVKAKKATEILHNKYKHTFDKLKKDRTYIFEAIYPESQVLIDYGNEEELILIGVLDTLTGKDRPLEDIGFKVAKDWTSDLTNVKNLSEIEKLNFKNMEGFVLVYDNGFRVKIKFPWYKEAHSLVNKLINLEYNIDLIESKIKEILSVNQNIPSKLKIWKRFSIGETPSEIINDFPKTYNYFGIYEWLEKEYSSYLTVRGKNSEELNFSTIKDEILIKDDLIYESYSENIMNNRLINIKRKYD